MNRSRRMGLLLRLMGPLIEVVCVAALLRWGGQGVTVLGRPVEPLLYGGLGLGLALVVVGLILSTRRVRDRAAEAGADG